MTVEKTHFLSQFGMLLFTLLLLLLIIMILVKTFAPNVTKIVILISFISYVSSLFSGKTEHSSFSIAPRNHVERKNVELFMLKKSDSETIEDERNKILHKASKLQKEVECLKMG